MPDWKGSPSQRLRCSSEECGLILEAQQGNLTAFEILYERYRERIQRYVTCLVGSNEAGTLLTQETFTRIWKSLPGLRQPAIFVSKLYQTATKCAQNYQRRHKHLPTYLHKAHEGSVQAALLSISQTRRACLILYVIEEFSQQEIAYLLNIEEATVITCVKGGYEELRHNYMYLHKGNNDAEDIF